jgi:dTDP-4-dehydrorhamnose reductase
MTILITGAFGFVGTNLSAYLAEKGHELWALDLLRPQSGRNDECKNGAYSRCFGWEKLDKIPWDEVDAVVHLAGKAHDTRNASDPQSYFEINVGLTAKVIEKFSRQDAKAQRKFILFSSVKAVADRVEGVLTEDAEPNPQTAYGKSKLEAEGMVRSSLVREGVSALVGEDGGPTERVMRVIEALEQENIESRPVWKPMHLQPVFRGAKVYGGRVSERLFERGVCLPSGTGLTLEEIDRICGVVESALSGDA